MKRGVSVLRMTGNSPIDSKWVSYCDKDPEHSGSFISEKLNQLKEATDKLEGLTKSRDNEMVELQNTLKRAKEELQSCQAEHTDSDSVVRETQGHTDRQKRLRARS